MQYGTGNSETTGDEKCLHPLSQKNVVSSLKSHPEKDKQLILREKLIKHDCLLTRLVGHSTLSDRALPATLLHPRSPKWTL